MTADTPTRLSTSAAYLSARQAADYCGVSEKTIRNWIAAGRLSADKSADGFRILVEALAPLRRPAPQTPHPADGSADGVRADGRGDEAATVNLLPALADALQLVREQQERLLQATAAAAMWQERARMLEAELARLRETPALGPGESLSSENPSLLTPRPWWAFWRRWSRTTG